MRDPERGAAVIAADCRFEDVFKDVAHGEAQIGPDGDRAVVEFVNRGTQTGPLESPFGTFPPSGPWQETRYCNVMRVADGKVVEGRDCYDALSIARQLGLMP